MEFLEEQVDDFDEFLNDQYEKDSTNGIQDDDSANYYIGRLKRNRDMIEMYENKAKDLKESFKLKVDLWKEKKVDSLNNDIEHCLSLLKEYYDRVAKSDKTKIRLPEGTLGFYKTRESIKIDEKEVLPFLQNYNLNIGPGMESFIETVPTVNKKAIREAGYYDLDTLSYKIRDVVIPGITFKPAETKFNVR